MSTLDAASLAVLVVAAIGLVLGVGYALVAGRGPAGRRQAGRTIAARAGSYAVLAAVLVLAVRAGTPGVAAFVIAVGGAALLEWSRLFGLPTHHAVSLMAAHLLIVVAIALRGEAAATWLVAGVVLTGAAWPVVRADTGRAVRDLGFAAVGAVFVSVLLVHAVLLVEERGMDGSALLLAIAAGCAGSDVGAYLVGRRYGRTPLAPRLSPNKTRAGLVGNLLGAALALLPFTSFMVGGFGSPVAIVLVPLVAAGSVWGDLLESAVKREAGVKDAGAWLPGFGGILDRIDSLLISVALAFWAVRVLVDVR